MLNSISRRGRHPPFTEGKWLYRLLKQSSVCLRNAFVLQVTKPKYFHKPTYETLQSSLNAMKQHCVEHEVKMLAMPRIGCGLDRLEWSKVKEMIIQTFQNTNTNVTIYTL